ncbi:hypothetical protein R3P38DRAFT_3344619 [Favolaschia claudopus]|uniref:Uncharacterized protein n=1 Tax=Favolaschia claudopus TaxID=2862362 RepID=A0AAW0DEW3_9AGAR
MQFVALVKKLESPTALITNRDACRKYIGVLDSEFASRVCRAVDEREVARVILRQLGAGFNGNEKDGASRRKEDVINLHDLVEIAEAVSMHDTTYLTSTRAFDADTKTAHNILAIDGKPGTVPKELRVVRNEPVQVFAQNATKRLGSIGEVLDNDEIDRVKEGINRLTESVRSMERESREEYRGMAAWCRNKTDGLWEENRALKDGLEDVFIELGLVKERLSDSEVLNERRKDQVDDLRDEMYHNFDAIESKIRTTVQTGLQHTRICETARTRDSIESCGMEDEILVLRAGLDDMSKGLRWIGGRSLNLEELVEQDGRALQGLRDEMMNSAEKVQDELLTIQTRLRRAGLSAMAPVQVCGDVEAFLMNRMRAEIKRGDNDVPGRDKRAMAPLLSKKQRRHLKRVEKQRAAKAALGSGWKLDENEMIQDETGEVDKGERDELHTDEESPSCVEEESTQ